MGPKPADERADQDLFRTELLNLINQRHELPPESLLKLPAVNDLPALLYAGGQFGDLPGGLVLLASIVSMLEFKFSVTVKAEKWSKK